MFHPGKHTILNIIRHQYLGILNPSEFIPEQSQPGDDPGRLFTCESSPEFQRLEPA